MNRLQATMMKAAPLLLSFLTLTLLLLSPFPSLAGRTLSRSGKGKAGGKGYKTPYPTVSAAPSISVSPSSIPSVSLAPSVSAAPSDFPSSSPSSFPTCESRKSSKGKGSKSSSKKRGGGKGGKASKSCYEYDDDGTSEAVVLESGEEDPTAGAVESFVKKDSGTMDRVTAWMALAIPIAVCFYFI